MSLQPELYIDRVVEVVFVDHVWSADIEEVLLCKIWGKVIKSDWQKVVVQVWETNGSAENNAEYAIIVRSAIHSIRPLMYDEEK